jgi:serine protease Do
MVMLVIAATLSGACTRRELPGQASQPATGPASASDVEVQADSPSVTPVAGAPATFADLVETVRPAVVNIFTSQVRRTGRMSYHPSVYGMYGVPETRVERSLGSGFIIDERGHILTNTHVIADATEIRVQLADATELPATVVGVDAATDIAIIRIQPFDGMSVLPLGDSEAVRVGDWLLAVGNPFGLASTVTAGILSARGRRDVPLGRGVRYVDFLQTDVSINPGNSGGPLVNMAGQAIGINTAINREGQGIGFAIPINMARDLLPALVETGRVSRSWLGVFVDRLTPELASSYGLASTDGALVRDVVQGGPAAIGGIAPGDVILRIGERPVMSSDELAWLASTAGVGQSVGVVVADARGTRTVQVVLGELPE